MINKIENEFGNKIGGSRRDMWNPAGLDINDASQMNDAERAEYIKKDNIWAKPDYQALKDEGRAIEAVYFIKQLRDSLAAKPTYGNGDFYIEVIGKIRDLAMNVKTVADVDCFKNLILKDPYWVEQGGTRWSVKVTEAVWTAGRSFFSKMQTSSGECRSEIRKKKFLYSEDEKIFAESRSTITVRTDAYNQFIPTGDINDSGKDSMVKTSEWQRIRANGISPADGNAIPEGKYILIMGYSFVGAFDTAEEAKERAIAMAKLAKSMTPQPEKRKGKKTFCYAVLDNIVQTETAEGKSGEDFINDFGFYGGEFGNWLNNDERQKNLDMSYVSFRNIARALNIPESAVSITGKLSIAFGARGKGNALAHFEPLRKVINLTKLRGAGSLAHEYGHAIDFIVASLYGCGKSFMETADQFRYFRHIPSEVQSIKKVVNAMLYTPEGGKTQYWKNSSKMGALYSKQGGYWDSCVEMWARAFACYVRDKLEALGITDGYLSGHSDLAIGIDTDGSVVKAYPEGEERTRINAAFDEFFDEIRPVLTGKAECKNEAELTGSSVRMACDI